MAKDENISIFKTIALAFSCAFISAIGFGLVAPLFALRMDDNGLDSAKIGYLVTFSASAPLFFTPFIPKILNIFTTKWALFLAIIINVALHFLLLINNSPWLWSIARFGFALSGTFLFIASESWVLEFAPPRLRGRILGFYAVIFYGGIGIGGVLISQFGYKANFIIYLAMALNILILPLFALKTLRATKSQHIEPFWATYKLIWANFAIFLPAFAIGGLETAAFNLFPIWARKIGFDDSMAGSILGFAAIGNILLQFPIGILADKLGRRNILLLITMAAILLPLALITSNNKFFVLTIVCLWSGVVTGFYTIGLVGIAEFFPPQRIAHANAAFGTTYCIAQLLAPSFGGALMQGYGPPALMVSLAIIGALPLFSAAKAQNAEKQY